jgi:hypothetical protein
MTEKQPHEWPIINRDGRIYSFLDCTCEDNCKQRDCKYCAFEIPEGGCPGAA